MARDSEYVTLKELSERRKIPEGSLYQKSRHNEIPGMRRFGRVIRVNLHEFDEATRPEHEAVHL
ncbi:MAG: hypothetical protein QGI83_17055 [Candidatus Latescibacteria bacterium]|jgi:hypothetical protein|nr:hypothetical protein [Candidatus Latescibacterota bacterium]